MTKYKFYITVKTPPLRVKSKGGSPGVKGEQEVQGGQKGIFRPIIDQAEPNKTTRGSRTCAKG